MKNKVVTKLLSIIFTCFCVLTVINPIWVFAETTGTSGTVNWVIDDEGTLTLSPANGVGGTLESYTTGNGPWYNYRSQIKKVVVEPGVKAGAGCYRLFSNFTNCTEIDLANLDTSDVTNMASMFSHCSSLTKLDVSNFDTSNVTDMNYMFYNCKNLAELDVSGFNTSNVTGMGSMFYYCSSLASLDTSNFDTSKVTDMDSMFYYCSSLASLDTSNFDTSKVTDMGSMFQGCSKLTVLDLSSFATSGVTDMGGMFASCSKLTELDVSDFDTSKVTNMGQMFYNCSSLTELDVSNFDTSKVTSMYRMFYYCSSLASLDISNFDTSKVTNMTSMFCNCSKLTELDVSSFNTSNVTSMFQMFSNCSELTSLDLSNFDTSKVTSIDQMFSNCSKLTELDVSDFDTSKVTTMSYMFYGCSNLTDLEVSDFDTSKVTHMGSMFNGCSNLTELDVSGFDTSNVTNMSNMFQSCTNLTSLDVSGFDTSNVTNMETMFSDCSKLAELDVSDFDTSKVTNMAEMFNRCSSLTELDVSGFDTSKVTNMYQMFNNCSSLTSLNLSNFDTSKVTNMSGMFSGMTSLKSIVLPDTFSFTGKNITSTSYKGLLPKPASPSTGWKRIYDANNMARDNSETVYTAIQLRDQWDPSTMAGLWVWDTEDMSSSGYGDSTKIHSVDPNWRQLNEDTWVYKFNVFDDTLPYYVTEDILPGFISDIPADPGYIMTNNKEATITNTTTTERGALTVTKTVDGEADPNDEFDFTLTLNGPGIGGTQIISDVVFTDGVGHFKLKGGETKVFNGLNEGITYSVEEEELFDYETESSNAEGIITKEGCIAAFVNTPITTLPEQPGWPHDNNTASLTVAKNVVDPYGSASGEYTFTVELMGLDANATYAYTLTNASNVTSALQPFGTDAQGDATLSLTLGDHEYLQFGALPEGARFRVTEDGGNYINSYVINSAGNIIRNNDRVSAKDSALSTQLETIDASMLGSNSEIVFTNTYDEYRDLVITKHIDGNTNARFEFTVSLRGLTPNAAYNSSIGRIVADDEGEAEKTFYLAKDESVTIEKLPVGTEYSVEESASVFIASYAINGSEPVASDAANKALSTGWNELGLAEATNVDFTNTVETASLKLKKVVVDGDTTDNNKEFEFTITLKNGLGTEESRPMPVAGEFAYTGSKEGTITFDNSGRGTVTLKHNQQIEILELPVGTIYTIEEADYSADDFVLSEKTNDSGAIVSGGVESQFTNAKESKAALTISKTVFGNTASKDKEFNFTITLKDKQNANVNGEFNYTGTKQGTLTFEDGVATISLAHNDSITIADLPVGGKYTIAEDDYTADGYSVVHTNATGTLTKAGVTATFQNINDTHLPTGMYIDRNAAAAGMLFGMATLWIVHMAVRRKLNKA